MNDIISTAVATPAPVAATVATPAPDSTAEQVATTPDTETPEVAERTFTQKELDEVVQKRLGKESRRIEKLAQAQARAEYAERERDALAAKLNPPAQKPSGEPVPAQFQDYESYIAALTDWKVDQKLNGVREQSENQQRQREQAEKAAQIAPKVQRGREKYDDFEEVVSSFDRVPPAAQAAMLESDITDDLYYYLGSNHAELDRISRLSPVAQVKAIDALEKKLTAAPSITKTPAPIVPNGGKAPVAKPLHEQSYDEFVKSREARLKSQRRR